MLLRSPGALLSPYPRSESVPGVKRAFRARREQSLIRALLWNLHEAWPCIVAMLISLSAREEEILHVQFAVDQSNRGMKFSTSVTVYSLSRRSAQGAVSETRGILPVQELAAASSLNLPLEEIMFGDDHRLVGARLHLPAHCTALPEALGVLDGGQVSA